MAELDDTYRAVAEAKEAIAFGDFPRALDKLRTAIGSLPAGDADAAGLVARIRAAADDVAKGAPRYAPEARDVRDLIIGRVGYVSASRAEEQRAEPWFYGVAEAVAYFAVIAAILSVIGGIVGAVEVARHHSDSNALWVLMATAFTVAVWLAIAVGLELLVEIGRSLRASRSER